MKKMNDMNNKSGKNACLDETRINRYVLQQCSAKEQQEIEAHLVACPQCRMEVVFLTKAQPDIQDKKKWAKLPEELYSKGMDLIKKKIRGTISKSKISVLEICLRFVSETWEVVRYTGRIMPQPALAARGDIPKKKAILSNIVKDFDEFRVEVDVSGNKEGAVDLQIRVKRLEEMNLEPQIQFTLLDKKGERVLEETIHDGENSFKGLSQGIYSIKIAQKEKIIGEICLNVEKKD